MSPAAAPDAIVDDHSRRVPVASIIGALVFAFMVLVGARSAADPDLWGHVKFGRVLLDSRSLPASDPYAFTTDRPWINHEWLAELAMGAAYQAGGVPGLSGLKLVLLLASLTVVALAVDCASKGGSTGVAIFAYTGLLGVLPLFTTFRPNAFSVLLFACELAILSAARPRLWLMPIVFALWANCHGGWLMGLGVFAVWLALRQVRPQSGRDRLRDVVAGLAAVAATLLTPYGTDLWRFLSETVSFDRSDIVEWQSVLRLPELLLPWGITTALGVWATVTKRVRLPSLAVCILLAAASFRVARMVPFYSLATGVLLAPGLVASTAPRGSFAHARSIVGAVALAALLLVRQSDSLACWRPAGGLRMDPEAHAFIRANELGGRMVVWFDWGEYVIWHFPRLSVSIDGRRETVYPDETLQAHQNLYRGGTGSREYLDRLSADYVWLPTTLPLSGMLENWGWRAVFTSDLSKIWTRSQGQFRPAGVEMAPCFPGP